MTHAMARTELLTARLRLRWFTEDDAGLMLSADRKYKAPF
jgi:hypothetical protein